MKFSIVTISFNQAEFLERTIQSVISQKGVEIDYIMVDPGSTDGSRDIIEKYKNHFSHIILEKDQGPGDGLNRGFAVATGDIYAYLNSDDTFEPDAFAKAAQFLQTHPHYDVICGHAFVTDKNDAHLRRVWSEPFERYPVAYGAAVQIQPSTFIRKNAFIKSGGFNPTNRSNWDGELMTEMYLSGARIGIINEFLSTYRLHAVSITNSGSTADKIKSADEKRFMRLMGRNRTKIDRLLVYAFQTLKHLRFPLYTWERLTRGPIFNRGVE